MQCPSNPSPFELQRLFEQLGIIGIGQLLTQKAVSTSTTTIAHGLGRVPKGWIEVSPLSGADPVQQAAAPDAANLYLVAASAVAAATLWVF